VQAGSLGGYSQRRRSTVERHRVCLAHFSNFCGSSADWSTVSHFCRCFHCTLIAARTANVKHFTCEVELDLTAGRAVLCCHGESRACEWGLGLPASNMASSTMKSLSPHPGNHQAWNGVAEPSRCATIRDGHEELSVLPAGLWVGCGESGRMKVKGHAGTEESVEFLGEALFCEPTLYVGSARQGRAQYAKSTRPAA
jgi:hypothetical protein